MRSHNLPILGLLALSLLGGGCYDDKSFTCQEDSQCVTGERCIGSRCAARDATCSDPKFAAYRYTRSAGSSAGACALWPQPDGLPCIAEGDRCEDHDPCTLDDKCAVKKDGAGFDCKGSPKECPATQCKNGPTGGVRSDFHCEEKTGECKETTVTCGAFPCAGTICATSCKSMADCVPGAYCRSDGKCLLCEDFLSSGGGGAPKFSALAPVDGLTAGTLEGGAVISSDRLTLIFASERPGGKGAQDIYKATRAMSVASFGAAENLSLVNSDKNDFDPFLQEKQALFFASNRNGSDDLFQAQVMADSFGGAGALDSLNMKDSHEGHPTLLADGKTIIFETDRAPATPPVIKDGDKWLRLYSATRDSAMGLFTTSPKAMDGLDVTPTGVSTKVTFNFSSPSVSAGRGVNSALFMVNKSLPAHAEIAFALVDSTGKVVTPPSIISGRCGDGKTACTKDADCGHCTGGKCGNGMTSCTKDMECPADGCKGLILGAGGTVAVSPDACFLLVSTPKRMGDLQNLYIAYRNDMSACATGCGATDGCCPANCTRFADVDCPYPRTNEVKEYFSANDKKYDYYLAGQSPPMGSDFMPTGKSIRLLADEMGKTSPLTTMFYRWVNTTCDGKRLVAIAASSPGAGYSQESKLGYGWISSTRVEMGSAVHRAVLRKKACDKNEDCASGECVTVGMTKVCKVAEPCGSQYFATEAECDMFVAANPGTGDTVWTCDKTVFWGASL